MRFTYLVIAAGVAIGCRPKSASDAAPDAEQSKPPTQTVEPKTVSSSDETTKAAAECLGWKLTSPVCRAGQNLVVLGLGQPSRNVSLSRDSAATRARLELGQRVGRQQPSLRIRSSRVPRVVPCGQDRHIALAVIRAPVDVEACPASIRSVGAASEACPSWTLTHGEETERGFIGVGVVDDMANEQLALQTARHRAINNALSVDEVEIRSGATVARPRVKVPVILEQSVARCGEATYSMVEIETPTGEPTSQTKP